MTTLKKLLLLLFILILPFNLVNAQGWVQQTSGTSINLNCVYFINANTGFIGADGGIILKTTNGGSNWLSLNTQTNRIIYSIKFVDANTGFAATRNKILKTTNAGISWDTTINGGGQGISFINSSTGYSLKQIYLNSIWKTTNAGSSWDSLGVIPVAIGPVNKIHFLNEMTGYACGNSYTMSFMFYNAIITGTTNSGINWGGNGGYSGPNTSSGATIFDIYFQSNSGFAVGYEGSISYFFRSTNTGVSWIKSSISDRMNSVKFTDANTGWLCGVSGKIMYTINAGSTWSDQVSGTTSTLNEVFMVNSTVGYITGQNGTILKTTNGGITAVQQTGTNIPDNFSLRQNYPNPFNPVTQINFDIPKSSLVNLIIFDANGREIEVLANNQLGAGSYSVDWNASAYPSGVYFYKITAGEFVETRKMVLVK